MLFSNNKERGNAGMALSIAYFGANGYINYIPNISRVCSGKRKTTLGYKWSYK